MKVRIITIVVLSVISMLLLILQNSFLNYNLDKHQINVICYSKLDKKQIVSIENNIKDTDGVLEIRKYSKANNFAKLDKLLKREIFEKTKNNPIDTIFTLKINSYKKKHIVSKLKQIKGVSIVIDSKLSF